jgi:hypothetical protein
MIRFFVTVFLLSSISWARPEYAAQVGVVSCTACHVNPSGGGLRNAYGKNFGLRNMGKNSISQKWTWFGGDVRALHFLSEETQVNKTPGYNPRGGLGIMSSIVSANIPVDQIVDEDSTENPLSLMVAYNFGQFQTEVGLRETYIRYEDRRSKSIFSFGKFLAPFGLLTDEHRAYARIQSRTTYNDFQTGLMWSWDSKNDMVHTDVALTQGVQASPAEAEGSLSNGKTYAAFANVRHVVPMVPMTVGASYQTNQRSEGLNDPWAWSVYQVLSLNKLTRYWFNGAVLLEYQRAKYWNDSTINPDVNQRISSTVIGSGLVARSESEGWFGQLNWDLSPKWTVMYRYDHLVFDKDFSGDAFRRHGVGFRWFMAGNLNLMTRYEFAKAGSGAVQVTEPGAQNALWSVLHMWF